MSLRVVVLFLLVMIVIALMGGPGVRRAIRTILGINRRDR